MMKPESIYKFFTELSQDKFSFIYHGSFSDEITELLIELSEQNMKSSKDRKSARKKMSFLMAECYQNVVRHGGLKQLESVYKRPNLFIIRYLSKTYYLVSTNVVDNEQVKELKEKLNRVNELPEEELKRLRVEILSDGKLSDKGGAGLGLIEIARKSGQKLEYYFDEINSKYSLFLLQVQVKAGECENEHKLSLRKNKQFSDLIHSMHIYLMHKDNFTQESILPVLKMVEQNMQSLNLDINIKKTAFIVLLEILQNISKHAYEENGHRTGIFYIGKSQELYFICSGNYIANEKVDLLTKTLNEINSFSKKELNDEYLRKLREGTISDESAGLGFLDIAREISNGFHFQISEIDNQKSFFALVVNL